MYYGINDIPITDFQLVADKLQLDSSLAVPSTGKPLFLVNSSSIETIGGFSCFLQVLSGEAVPEAYVEDSILVGFYPKPSWTEVAWSWYRKPNLEIWDWESDWNFGWPRNTEPELVWIGGDCGNNQVWLSRGLSYGEVLTQLQENLQLSFDDIGYAMDDYTIEIVDPNYWSEPPQRH